MLAADQNRVTAVDINPYAFELARSYFRLSPQVVCVLDDAGHYLETATQCLMQLPWGARSSIMPVNDVIADRRPNYYETMYGSGPLAVRKNFCEAPCCIPADCDLMRRVYLQDSLTSSR